MSPSASLARRLGRVGLLVLGRFVIEKGDIGTAGPAALAGRSAVLVGNAGSGMWEAFSACHEFADGRADPLDRWTRRVVGEALAGQAGGKAQALFPFGNPVWPFQRWARRAMGVEASPLGLLIHPEYGLWFALRAAIVTGKNAVEKPIQVVEKVIHPCAGCREKPCLSACPVEAFSPEDFAVERCRSYLDSRRWQIDSAAPDCMQGGCAAREACPVGRNRRYPDAQVRFHMSAYG